MPEYRATIILGSSWVIEKYQAYVGWRYGAQPPKLNQLRRRWQDLKKSIPLDTMEKVAECDGISWEYLRPGRRQAHEWRTRNSTNSWFDQLR